MRAGIDGVLQLVPVEVGQRVAPGTNLARVARPDKLKAELRIPETQAKDVEIGQKAVIDTRNGIVAGRVDPRRPGGRRTARSPWTSRSTGELPQGARPDLTVDGTIELERLQDVALRRPPGDGPGAEHGRPLPHRRRARTRRCACRWSWAQARSARSRSRTGSRPGDQVILSDMSAWDAA